MNRSPRIKDICERLGLSKATVSKALNGYPSVKEETRQQVLAVAKELGYDPAVRQAVEVSPRLRIGFPPFSRSLASSNSPLEDIQNGFLEQAALLNYDIIMLQPNILRDQNIPYDQMVEEAGLDGVFMCGLRTDDPYFCQLASTKVPTVTWDLTVNNPHVCNVFCDSREGMRLVTEHLIGLGHRRIGFICGHRFAQVSIDRLDGYILALEHADIRFDPQLVYYSDFSEAGGEQGAAELVSRGVTGIVCISDSVAVGAVRTLNRLGMRIPEDVSLTGFDDSDLARIVTPSLTSVQQNGYQIGRIAAHVLRDIQTGRPVADVILHPSLTIRSSTAKPADK